MIIGKGFIADSFRKAKYDFSNEIIFASGVSDSSSNNKSDFLREINLLDSFIKENKRLIYFSTVSIFDTDLSETAYVKHKIYIEEKIKKHFSNYLIYRLPIVVGFSKNPKTLINFLANNIHSKLKFSIYTNACRYLIDIDDVIQFVCQTILNQNSIINVTLYKQVTVLKIVQTLEQIIHKQAIYELEPRGGCYQFNENFFRDQFAHIKDKDYLYNLLKKYYNRYPLHPS